MTRWNDGVSLFIGGDPEKYDPYFDIWHSGGPGGPMLMAQSREAADEICAAVDELLELRAEVKRLRAGVRAAEVHLDLEAIKKRHLNPERNRGRTYYLGHIEVDLAACVEEIERLREEAHEMRVWAVEPARAENANAQETRRERDAVVAFLLGARLDELSAAIKRGEHLPKEQA